MSRIQAGVYSAPGQPDIIVLYDGHLRDDAERRGPWIQWNFPWESREQYQTTLWYEFEQLLAIGKYRLTESRSSLEMQFGDRADTGKDGDANS